LRKFVRPGKRSDFAGVNDLASSLVGFEAERQATCEAVLAHPDHDLVVAEVNGDVVGFVHLLTCHDRASDALAPKRGRRSLRWSCITTRIGERDHTILVGAENLI